MKRNFLLLITGCAVALFSCKATQALAQITPQPSIQSDTLPVMASSDTLIAATLATDTDSTQRLLQKLDSQSIRDFNTFAAKAKINSSGVPVPITANIRIRKDSIIWVSLSATVLITAEVARAKITRDSVWLIDKYNKNVIRRSISFLQTLLKAPFTFDDVQNIILGNPLLTRDSVLSDTCLSDSIRTVLTGNDTLKNFLTVQNSGDSTLLLLRNILQEITATGSLSCDISYSGYQPTGNGKYFSRTRNITLAGNNAVQQATLQFINFGFDKPMDFPFNIPDGYSEK